MIPKPDDIRAPSVLSDPAWPSVSKRPIERDPSRDPSRDPLAWAARLGQAIVFDSDGWTVRAQLDDARAHYGRVQLRVTQHPGMSSARSAWISSERVAHAERRVGA